MLIGTWEGVEAYVWSKEGGEYYDEPDTEDTSNTRMEYKEDGTVLGFEYYGGQWHLESEEGKWRISGDKLIVAISEGGESYEITSKVLKLTATELELEIYEKYKEEGVTYEEYAKDIFRKVD